MYTAGMARKPSKKPKTKKSQPGKRTAKTVTDVSHRDALPRGTPTAQVAGEGVVMESKIFDGTVETESATVSDAPGDLDEAAAEGTTDPILPPGEHYETDPLGTKHTTVPAESESPPRTGGIGPIELRAEGAGATRADADWRRAAAGTRILRRPPGGESVGRTIVARRQEILETGPGLKATIDEILVWYGENPPNDPDTQKFVERLGTLSTGLDTYLAMLRAGPTEAKAERAGRSLFKKALSAIKSLEKSTAGDKFLRLTMYAGVLGTAAIAAPMVSPYLTVPLMTACVFPAETKVATGLFNVLKDLGEKYGVLPSKSDEK